MSEDKSVGAAGADGKEPSAAVPFEIVLLVSPDRICCMMGRYANAIVLKLQWRVMVVGLSFKSPGFYGWE